MKSQILILALFTIISCSKEEQQAVSELTYPIYEIALEIEPNNQFIRVNGTLTYPIKSDSLEKIVLYLHRQLDVSKFSINGKDDYTVDTSKSDIRYMPEADKIILNPEQPMKRGKIADIDFAYEGRITDYSGWSPNVISEEWTELGLYFPWFPFNMDLRPMNYALKISGDDTYNYFAMGEQTSQNEFVKFTTIQPVNDIVVCAAKDLKIRNTKVLDNSFSLAYFDLTKEAADSIVADIEIIYQCFNNWFGRKEGSMSLVQSKRERGGGYARTGGIFLAGLDSESYLKNRKGYYRYIGHELSHIWWHKANSSTWEDWLNEGFAEYSALMLVREKFGEGEFNNRLSNKEEESKNTTSVWGFDRNGDKNREAILYSKAPILLNKLNQKIGNEKFRRLCKNMISKDISTTKDFLKELTKISNENIAGWFKNMLKTV